MIHTDAIVRANRDAITRVNCFKIIESSSPYVYRICTIIYNLYIHLCICSNFHRIKTPWNRPDCHDWQLEKYAWGFWNINLFKNTTNDWRKIYERKWLICIKKRREKKIAFPNLLIQQNSTFERDSLCMEQMYHTQVIYSWNMLIKWFRLEHFKTVCILIPFKYEFIRKKFTHFTIIQIA